jgi:hypothetical protein
VTDQLRPDSEERTYEDALDVPSGLIAAGMNSEDVAETAGNLSYGYGSLYSSGERTGLTLSFAATDADAARTVEEQFDGLLDDTEIVREGSTVTVRTGESGGELASRCAVRASSGPADGATWAAGRAATSAATPPSSPTIASLEASADYEATVVWESNDGSASTTLAQDTGPGV